MKLSHVILTSFTVATFLAAPIFTIPAHAEDGVPPPPAKGGKFFEKMDTDGDGKISEAEHLEGAKHHFAMMDADGDGYVTKEEMQAKKKKMHEKMKDFREKKMTVDSE